MPLPTQQQLANFYHSVAAHDPYLANEMESDIQIVAIWALGGDKSGGQDAANRLREATRPLPVVFAKMLDGTLTEMGYE